MANFGRVKTWGNETLTAGDLNSEFDNVINNVTSGSVSSANIDLTDGYAWTGAHTFSVDMKVLNGAGVIVGNTAQVTTSSAGEFQVLGTAAADSTAIIGHWAAAATGGKVSFVKSRNATIGSSTIVADNDVLGTIEFMADDGSDFATPAASIFARVNGTPGANDMPGELVLAVTADAGNAVTERVRILQNGTVELNSGTLSFDGAASIDTSGNAILSLSAGTADIQVTASNLTPASNDGSALGVSGTAWSDLFLASGSVVNWVAGDITLTHSAGKLTFGGDGAVELDFNNHEMTNVDVNSGAIDGAIIGAASAAAGSFAAIVGTSLDVNGAADISGDLTLSAGADGALTFANAGENSIKIPDNQASALIVEEADNAYLTFVSTNSGEKITLGKKLEAGSVEIEGSAFDINGGAIDGAIIGAASAAAGTFAAIVGTSLNMSDGNITNVGDISLDSISSDAGTSINVVLGSDAGDDFTVDTAKLVVEGDTGNVGIGTAAPGNQLEIAKSAVEAILELSCWSTTDGHHPLLLFQKSGSATIGTMAVTADGEILGAQHFHGVNTSSGTSSAARIQVEQDGGGGSTYIPGRIEFQCATDASGIPSAGSCVVTATAFRPGANDAYDLGTSSYRYDDVFATNGTIDTSDLNRKTAIEDTDLGLDFVEKLRPVSYKFKDYTAQQETEDAAGNAITVDVEKTFVRRHYGLIAQEIETVLAGKDCAALIKSPKEGGGHDYGLRYTQLIAPLIKAVQELSAKIKILEAA